MKISDIHFPAPLLAALRDGSLVAFAGAGVSAGKPASLPKFSALAKSIAQGTGQTRRPHESEDVFLGRLQHRVCSFATLPRRFFARIATEPSRGRLACTHEFAGDAVLPGEEIEVELAPDGNDGAFRELWETDLRPRLDIVAEPVLSIAVAHLAARHRTFLAWQKADRDWDPESFARHAIEPHEQDHGYDHVDVLIDAARDCLEWLARNRPDASAGWCGLLARSRTPLLRRLCVHTLSVRNDLSACQNPDWLFANADLHDDAAHHELFRIMRELYPRADPERRGRMLDIIRVFCWSDAEEEQKTRLAARHQFDWLHWLHMPTPLACAPSRPSTTSEAGTRTSRRATIPISRIGGIPDSAPNPPGVSRNCCRDRPASGWTTCWHSARRARSGQIATTPSPPSRPARSAISVGEPVWPTHSRPANTGTPTSGSPCFVPGARPDSTPPNSAKSSDTFANRA